MHLVVQTHLMCMEIYIIMLHNVLTQRAPENAIHDVQEAQLSQRDRAVPHVIEYFVNSLKITQGHSE